MTTAFFLLSSYIFPLLDLVNFAYAESPTNLGWNTSLTYPGDPGHRPVELACGGYTNQNSIAHNWSDVSGATVYQREWMVPGSGSWTTDPTAYAVTNTAFSTFGGGSGIEGTWNTRVRADDGVGGWQEWSNECEITYDVTAPVVDVTSHLDGDVLSGTVTISGTVTDANPHHFWAVVHNASNVTVPGLSTGAGQLGYGVVNYATSFTDQELFNWDTTQVPDGTYTIKLEARDSANNKDASASVEWVTVTVNNAPDPVAWVTPTAPAFLTRNGDAPYTGTQVIANMSFEQSTSSDVAFYEYQYVRRDLSGAFVGSGIVNMNSYMGGVTCSAGVCTWSPNMELNYMWIFRVRTVDTIGQRSAWSNWNDISTGDFAAQTFNYTDYIGGVGLFGRPDYNSSNGGFAAREQIAPVSAITAPASGLTNMNPLVISYTASDVDTAVKQVELYYSYEGGAYSLYSTDNAVSGDFNFTYPNGNGTYCFYTIAEDIVDDLTLDAGVGNREAVPADPCELQIIVDLEPPFTTLSSPTDNSYWNDDVNGIHIVGQSVDNLEVESVTISWSPAGANTWTVVTTLTNAENDDTFDWNTYWLPSEGVYDIKAEALDTAGNVESTAYAYNVTFDITNPTLTVTTPVHDSLISGTFPVAGTAGDNLSGIQDIRVRFRNESDNALVATFWATYNTGTGEWAIDVNDGVNNVADGYYRIVVRAQDMAGNTRFVTVRRITIDNTPPDVPADLGHNIPAGAPNNPRPTTEIPCGGYTNVNSVAYNWSNESASGAVVYEWQRQNPISGTWNSQPLRAVPYTLYRQFGGDPGVEGTWNVRVRAQDLAGNWSDWSTGCAITFDRTMPTSDVFIQGDLDETKNLAHNNGWHGYGWYESFDNVDLTITSLAGAAPDVVNYALVAPAVDCSTATYTQVAGGTNVASEVNALGDGEHKLCYYAEDLAGNIETPTHEIILRLDTSNPTYTIDGASGNYFEDVYHTNSDTVEIYLTVNDNLSGYTRARYDQYTADDSWNCTYNHYNQDNLLLPSTSTTRTLTESGLADGRYCYRVWIYDDVQNKAWSDSEGQQWVYFVVDHEAPTVDTIEDQVFDEGDLVDLAPLSGLGVGDNDGLSEACIAYSFTDTHGVPVYDIALTCEDITDAGTGGTLPDLSGLMFPIDTSMINEGTHEFTYYVTDLAGNRSDCDDEMEGDQNCDVTIVINNVAPIVDLQADQTINEGQSASFTGSFDDPSYMEDSLFGPMLPPAALTSFSSLRGSLLAAEEGEGTPNNPDDAQWTATIDYGDGTITDLGSFDLPGEIVVPDHTYPYVPATTQYTATLEVCEAPYEAPFFPIFFPTSEGECGTDSIVVTVTNLVPSVALSASPGVSVTAGTIVTLTANGSGGNSPLSYSWSGACSGSGNTKTVPSVAGTYTCNVTVTDFDGDTATDSITITVIAPAGIPGGTGGTGNGTGDGTGDATAPEEEEQTDDENEGEVLGALTCEEKTKVSGDIYYDKNGNGQKDEDEKSAEGVEVIITTTIDGETITVTTVKTDENGHWETELCPAQYEAKLNKDTLPEKSQVKGDDVLGITVGEDEEVNNVNFTLSENANSFNWWYCIIPLLILAALVVLYLLASRRGKK